MKKSQFLKEEASKGIKAVSVIAWLVALVCIGLVVYGAWLTVTIPVTDSPVLDYARSVAGSKDGIINEFETLMESDELYNHAKTSYEENVESLTEEERALAEEGLHECQEFTELPNVLNARSLYIIVLECVEHNNPASKAYAEIYNYATQFGDVATLVFNAIIVGAFALALIFAIFLLISAKVKNVVLVIITLIFETALNVVLLGIPYAVITAVALIILTVLICIVNGAYKKHNKVA